MEKIMIGKACKLEVWESQQNESVYIDGVIIGEVNGYIEEDFTRFDVKTSQGIFFACHPDCVNIL